MSSFSTDSAFVTLPAKGEDDWVRTAVGLEAIVRACPPSVVLSVYTWSLSEMFFVTCLQANVEQPSQDHKCELNTE